MSWMKESIEAIKRARNDIAFVYGDPNYDELAGRYLALRTFLVADTQEDFAVRYLALREVFREISPEAHSGPEGEIDASRLLRAFQEEIETHTS